MSELTRCNYCNLQEMRRVAAKRGAEVILQDDDGWVSARYSDRPNLQRWFLELTDHCVC